MLAAPPTAIPLKAVESATQKQLKPALEPHELASGADISFGRVLQLALSPKLTTVVLPSSALYEKEIVGYNLAAPFSPAAVVYPTTASEVSAAIRVADAYKVPVVARGGRYAHGGFGNGARDGCLVVDVSKLTELAYDQANQTIRVGAGNRLGDLTKELNKYGRATPGAAHPYIGVAGHALGGGFGPTSRMWGLMCDNIVEMDLVTPAGDVVKASAHSHADLYWALRGAGATYGVVLSFTLKTYAAPTECTHFSYRVPLESVSIAASSFAAFQDFVARAPSNLAISWVNTVTGAKRQGELNVFTDGEGGRFSTELNGVYYGSKASFEGAIGELLRSLPEFQVKHLETVDWWSSVQKAGADQNINRMENATNGQCHGRLFDTSIMTAGEDQKLGKDQLVKYFDAIFEQARALTDKNPEALFCARASSFGGNSAISAVSDLENAFAQRNKLLFFHLHVSAPNDAEAIPTGSIRLVKNVAATLAAGKEVGSYVNFADTMKTPAELKAMYYGGETSERYEKLVAVKKIYDPKSVMANPMLIGA